MGSKLFVVDGGVCRRFRAEVRDGLRWWRFREWGGGVWEVGDGCVLGITRWEGGLCMCEGSWVFETVSGLLARW